MPSDYIRIYPRCSITEMKYTPEPLESLTFVTIISRKCVLIILIAFPTFDGILNVKNVVGKREAEVKCARRSDPQSRELSLLHKPRQSCISPF